MAVTDHGSRSQAIPPRGDRGTVRPAAPIRMTIAGPAPQRRLTVAFRLFLALPHLLALAGLGLAAALVALAGWLAALVTGRLPRFAAVFLAGVLRWRARVLAYLFLLTDRYPPFSLAGLPAAAYPARLGIRRAQLSRGAVLMHLVLLVPALAVSALLWLGLIPAMVVIWLIVTVRGAMPRSAHLALATATQYLAWVGAYVFLLASEYPRGLLGDAPAPDAAEAGPAGSGDVATARRLTGLLVGLGLAFAAAGVAIVAVVAIHGAMVRFTAVGQVQSYQSALNRTLSSFSTQSASCQGSRHPLACTRALDRRVSHAYRRFAAGVRSTTMPSRTSAAAARRLAGDAMHAGQVFGALASATTAREYNHLAAQRSVQQVINRVGADYQSLGRVLRIV